MSDVAYYRARMEEELAAAGRALDPNVARAHQAMAQAYAARVEVLAADGDGLAAPADPQTLDHTEQSRLTG
jgi:hypothetical protein